MAGLTQDSKSLYYTWRGTAVNPHHVKRYQRLTKEVINMLWWPALLIEWLFGWGFVEADIEGASTL